MAEVLTRDVAQKAQRALAKSPIYALRDLQVEFLEDELLISGRVSTFYQKQLAQEAVRAVADGMQVKNTVDVTT